MKSTRRTIVRNVFIVALLFILMSMLVAFAHLYQPTPIIPPDPPERIEMAKDRALNGWWLCRDACTVAPRRPRPLQFSGIDASDIYWPYKPAPSRSTSAGNTTRGGKYRALLKPNQNPRTPVHDDARISSSSSLHTFSAAS